MKERDCQSDLIRVIAMIFVVGVHSLNFISDHITASIVIKVIIISCNPMFFMLSGKFNLLFDPGENEKHSYSNYYKKKFINIFMPFLVYCLLIHIYDYRDTLDFLTSAKTFGINFLTNNVSFHLWFMYELIGLLIGAPFLAKLVRSMSYLELKIFLSIAIIWNFISIILMTDMLQINLGFSGWILSGWMLYFILGYYCSKVIKKLKSIVVFIGIGAICFIITCMQIIYLPDRASNAYDLSPIYMFVTLAIYLFLDRILLIKKNCVKRIISFLAKYSFSIYLIHISVLKFISDYTGIFQSIQNLNSYIQLILAVIIIFVGSFILVFCIDNTLIKGIKKGLYRIMKVQ